MESNEMCTLILPR